VREADHHASCTVELDCVLIFTTWWWNTGTTLCLIH